MNAENVTNHLPVPNARGRALAVGFGVTVAMWAVAYVSLLQPGLVVGELLFAMELGCLFVGGVIVGRAALPNEEGWAAGMKIGFVSATLNLLLIGSLVGGAKNGDSFFYGAIWVVGLFAVSAVLGMLGGATGSMLRSDLQRERPTPHNWHYSFICVAAATVLLLLITGGLVTGLKAGLAVPDWPNTFGHNMLLYPVTEMVGGIYFEHAHRLYGMLVGVTAITVAVSMFFLDRRGWLRGLAIAYLLMVCVQGYMGGARVFEKSTFLAIVHGVFAQIVFCTIVFLAACTSTTWKSPPQVAGNRSLVTDRRWSHILSIALVLQLGLGASYRHMQRAMENPPQPIHVLFTHIGVALLVMILIIVVGGRAWGVHRDRPVLPALGRTLLILLTAQLTLGVLAVIVVAKSQPHVDPPVFEVVITTAHQITGAMMLATSVLLTVWTRRLQRSEVRGQKSEVASP